jgi:hypothetical protein
VVLALEPALVARSTRPLACAAVDPTLETRIREFCRSLPGASERVSHGAPAFFAGRQFVALWPEGHHERAFAHLWCAAPAGVQDALAREGPDWYFRPPYVGHRGWLGVRLDRLDDVEELTALCEQAYRTVASRRLVAELDASQRGPRASGA